MPLGNVVISQEEIRRRTAALAREIETAIPDGDLHVIITLKGGLFFGADLIRALRREVTLGFITASSYGGGTESTGKVLLKASDVGKITGRHVLIVEDIIDTGRTLEAVVGAIREQAPASVRTAALIDKPSRHKAPIDADFIGFPVEDVFLVGYGLDYAEKFRDLPDIRAFEL
ncbi:MAG TPA: hypoxanthine phosphoribosyltransferase [Nitrospinae bacterium]|nr:hypoxanthine phosphoribosyltransferase [Nitrospinota bacterium]